MDSFAAKESSNTSWKKGQTQVIYEIISKSVRKADKGVPNKNCDDQDECGSADDIFANDGSEHFSERLLTKDKVCPLVQPRYFILLEITRSEM